MALGMHPRAPNLRRSRFAPLREAVTGALDLAASGQRRRRPRRARCTEPAEKIVSPLKIHAPAAEDPLYGPAAQIVNSLERHSLPLSSRLD
jgi:hypothetical protein